MNLRMGKKPYVQRLVDSVIRDNSHVAQRVDADSSCNRLGDHDNSPDKHGSVRLTPLIFVTWKAT